MALAKHCRHLTSLEITSCCHVTDISLFCIGKYCHGLLNINMSGADVSDAGMGAIATGCPLLQRWKLWDEVTRTSGSGILALAFGCTQLQQLVTNNVCIDIHAVSMLTRNCPMLSTLVASGSQIDDECLHIIAQYLHNLVYLDASRSQISDPDSIRAVAFSCKRLKTFFVYFCCHLQNSLALGDVLAKCPHLQRFEY